MAQECVAALLKPPKDYTRTSASTKSAGHRGKNGAGAHCCTDRGRWRGLCGNQLDPALPLKPSPGAHPEAPEPPTPLSRSRRLRRQRALDLGTRTKSQPRLSRRESGLTWCGRCRIRTYVGISRRIYSPLPLAARAICRACTRLRSGAFASISRRAAAENGFLGAVRRIQRTHPHFANRVVTGGADPITSRCPPVWKVGGTRCS